MTTTTPNMNLILPDVSITAGPQWATLLNAAYGLIDSHDHSTGNGIKVTPSGLNISSDLSFGQNNATDLRSIRMFNNSSITIGVNDRTCLYSLNNELYYVDGAGNNIQLTLNGVIDLSGTITALTIKDSGFTIQYFGDVTRQMRFNLSAIPTATLRVMSVPDSGANDTFVTQAASQVLTNKTLTTPIIAAINTGSTTFTLPTVDGSSGYLMQTNGSGTLSLVTPPAAPPATIAANDSNVTFVTGDNHYQICNPTAPRTYTMPASLTAGAPWTIYNQATSWANVITLQTSGSNLITIVPPQGYVVIVPLTSTPTTAANWFLSDRRSKNVLYTPVYTGCGTVANSNCYAKIDMNELILNGSVGVGTVTASLFSVSIPSTLTINSALLTINNTSANTGNIVGILGGNGAGGQSASHLITAPATSTSVVYSGVFFASVTGQTTVPTNANAIFGSTVQLSLNAKIPVL